MSAPVSPPPARIETPRLVLRPWSGDDAPALQRIVRDGGAHLRPWMHWATLEAHEDLAEVTRRLAGFGEAFAAGWDWGYAMCARDDGRLVGGFGIHRRAEPRTLEMGYWLAADATGRGYVTEAVRAAVDAAFATCDVDRIEIRCDPHNERSAAVARRAGFRHVATLPADTTTPDGLPRDTMIWQRDRSPES